MDKLLKICFQNPFLKEKALTLLHSNYYDMKLRVFMLTLLLLTAVFVAEAHPVDMNTAREVAMKFMNANMKTPLRGTDDLQLVTTYNISRGDAAFRVFNTPNGFVIVSADDCATPILGYSNEGQFDVNNIPIQLQGYLQGFVEQIQYGIENYLEADEQTARQWELVSTIGRLTNNRSDEVVEPLLSTRWNQGSPYNMYVSNGYPTGCVATAMAQIMKYWEWPVQGTGQHSYIWNGQILSANFGETIYDWDNMLNDYSNNQGTQEQKEAVATLMWHCGVSVNMSYSPTGSGSALNSELIDYFSYSNEMRNEWRAYYSDATWKAKLKDCLNLGRPIYYVGTPNSGSGHAFVCDGYANYDLFHLNWGWSGSGNGYYALDAFIASGSAEYINNHHAILNIHPEGETTNYLINVSANNDEHGTVTGGGVFSHGSNVTLSATANSGYHFCYWEENGGIASTNPNYSFIANFNRNLMAVFAEPFTITVTATEGGTVSGGGSFLYGQSCTVIATADDGYGFANWTKNGVVVSVDANYTFSVAGESLLIAHFVPLEGNIEFADDNVKAICVANWDTNGDGELSYMEAALVLSLGEVFRGNTEITSFDELQFFIGLQSISENAFMACSGLTRLPVFSPSITSIGKYAFFGCEGMVGELTIPNTIVSIGYGAFAGCSGLTGSLIIPDSVTSIGDGAFHSCTGLTGSLIISNSVTSIGNYAFCNCYYIKGDLIIPNSVTIIGNSAFSSCYGLSGTLTIPDAVTSIGERAFYGCRDLSSIIVLTELPPILGTDAFYQIPITIPVYVPCGSVEVYQSSGGWNAFSNIMCITSGTISVVADPDEGGEVSGSGLYEGGTFCTVTASPNEGYCFANWTENGNVLSYDSIYSFVVTGERVLTAHFASEENIVFADANVKAICVANWDTNGDGELSYAEAAVITSLGEVFRGNTEITSFEELQYFISLSTISNNAFKDCSSLTGSLIIPNTVTSIGSYAFYNCSGFTGALIIPNAVTSIGSYAFYNCTGLTGSLIIPNNVTIIGTYAFCNCNRFTTLSIGNSVTSIGFGAFCYCNVTGKLFIPNSVISIGDYAFFHCNGLTGELLIPNSVTSIGNYAFFGCDLFTSLTILNSVTSIGNSAFDGCSRLTSMVVQAHYPPTLGSDVFNSVDISIPVYVPCESVGAYHSAAGWDAFTNFIGMCSSGTIAVATDPLEGGAVSGAGTYEGGTLCTVIATPSEGYDFANWTENDNVVSYDSNYSFVVTGDRVLTAHFVTDGNIDFADANVKAICVANWDTNGDGELSYAEAASVSSLGQVFYNETEITAFDELQFFIGLNSICYYAFYGCSGLSRLPIFPGSVKSIDYMAFAECTGLSGELIIPNTVTSIGKMAFFNCTGLLSSLIIGNSVTTIGEDAFYGCSNLSGTLIIGSSVSSIGGAAFYYCGGITSMVVFAETPPSVGSSAFYQVSTNVPVYVPCESVESYQTTTGWNAFSNILCISSGTISVIADPIEGGEVTGAGTYEGGAFCTVTATPSEGYVFANWTENGEVVSYDSNYCFVVTGNCVLTAHFVTDGNIVFADANVKAICVANWDTNGDGELSYVEAASVMSLGEVFYDHTEITSFEELQYFIGLTNISHHAFFNCSGLTGNLLIPNTVTSIGESAFWGCSGLTGDLVIPNSVTTIGNWAFLNCSGFTGSLTIGNSVTTIGYMAFRNCSGFRGGLTIGNSMNLIDDNAFSGCSGFTGDLTIPNSVTSIGNDAFRGCSSFTGNLTIPNSVTSIGDDAFYGCSGLTGDLVIPNTVTEIGGYTFYGCSGFTGNLTIPNSVTIIGSGAFQGCSGFTGNLTIPNSVTSLGYRAFYGCSGLTGNLIIPNSVTSIGSSAFYGCSGLTGDLVISNSVTTIGDYAFQGCSGFTGNLTIPNSVTIIGGGAFQGCSGFIGDLTIPNSVSSIESNTFYNCRGFTGCLTIPNTITSIGSNAFRGCSGLTAMIVFAETPPTVGASAFYNISTNIPVYVPCESVETYQLAEGWNAFSNIMCILSGTISVVANPLEGGEVSGAGMFEGGTFCTVTATPNEGYIFVNWTKNDIIVSNSPSYSFVVTGESVLTAHFVTEGNIVFADANVKAICVANWDTNGDGELSYAEAASVMSLGEVFRGNTEITSFEELQYFIGLTAISNYAFSGCSGFTGNLFIPNSVTSIGNYAFYNCSGFTGSLTIPNAVTSIGNSAFRNCSGFVGSLTIPNAVASIDDYAFYQCSGLSGSLTIHSSVTSIGNYAFSGCCGLTGDLVIPNSVTSIGGWAFYGCSGFTGSLTIGNSVATIGNVAFYGCSGFGSLTIPNSVTTIGNSAFDGCSGLNAVYYTGDVNQWCSIQFAFSSSNPLYYAHNLYVDNDLVTDLLIPETVREILDYTFYGATCLTSLTIPNSVTSIGEWAFYGCSNLTGDLVIPNSVTTIDEFAFSSCRGLTGSLTIPNSVTSIGYAAFSDCSGFNGTLTLPDSIASISGCAFRFCSGLTGSLTIPNAVTSIGWAAFQGCSGLTGSLIIPNSVTSIETTAFYNCNSLESVTMLSPSVPTLGGTAFSGTNANYYIYVPYASLNDYKTATNWSNYEPRILPMAYATVPGYGVGNDKWVFIASPLSEDVIPTTIDNMLLGTNYDLYHFDQSATEEEWQNYKVDSFNLVNGQGYVYANEVEVNIIFKGVFNEDETKVVSLDYDAEKANPGWNLVGNPFPVEAYIDRPYYVMNEDGTAINPIAVPASTPIPPCVGILVKAEGTGESVIFSRSAPETKK